MGRAAASWSRVLPLTCSRLVEWGEGWYCEVAYARAWGTARSWWGGVRGVGVGACTCADHRAPAGTRGP